MKYSSRRKKRVSARKLSLELGIFDSIRRIMKNNLGLRPYKIVIRPLLSSDEKIKRKKFANWVSDKFSKRSHHENTFLSNEKLFDIDGVYNFQNDRMWAVSRTDVNKKGAIKQQTKISIESNGLVRVHVLRV